MTSILLLCIAAAMWLTSVPAYEPAPPTPARAVLGQVLADPGASILDGPAPGDPTYPFVTADGYLYQAHTLDQSVTVEVYATPSQVADRKAALVRSAPDDRYFSGSYGGGSVLLR